MKCSVKFVAVVGLLIPALGLGFWPGPGGAQQPSSSGTAPPGIIVKPPGESDLQVGIQVGPGPYIVGRSVEGGTPEKPEFIGLSLNKQAVVYLLLINPEKEIIIGGMTFKVREVRLLFPNQHFQGNFLLKGEYTFPGPGLWERPFEILGPPGTAYIQVIATPVPIGLEPQIFEEPFPVLGLDPERVKEDIERRIQQKGLRLADWAAAWTQYEVLRTVPLTPQPVGNLRVIVKELGTGKLLAGAFIFVDGELRGITTSNGEATVTNLSAGSHCLRVERNGYKPWPPPNTPCEVTIVANQTTEKTVELEALPRICRLTATPPEAFQGEEILLDASGSSGPILLYEWSFEGNCTKDICVIDKRTREPYVRHIYKEAGPHRPKVVCVFEDGTTAWESVLVIIKPVCLVSEPPSAVFITKQPVIPANPAPLVRADRSITWTLKLGGARFVTANTSHYDSVQYADVEVQAGGPATLEFNYKIEAWPAGATIRSFVRVRFFDSSCESIKPEVVFTIPQEGGACTQMFPPWFYCKKSFSVPQNMAFVVLDVGLEVESQIPGGQEVSITYKNIILSPK